MSDYEKPRDYTLPDTGVVRLYSFGGIDVRNDKGEFISVATTPEACGALADLLRVLASGKMPDGGLLTPEDEKNEGGAR